jgi:hypothetical protein
MNTVAGYVFDTRDPANPRVIGPNPVPNPRRVIKVNARKSRACARYPHDPSGGVADSLDEAKAAFQAAWEAHGYGSRQPENRTRPDELGRVSLRSAHEVEHRGHQSRTVVL